MTTCRSHWDDVAPYVGYEWVSRQALCEVSGMASGNVQRGLSWARDHGVLDEAFEKNNGRLRSIYRLRQRG